MIEISANPWPTDIHHARTVPLDITDGTGSQFIRGSIKADARVPLASAPRVCHH